MFVRFVIQKNDADSGRRQGLFQALAHLEDAKVLLVHEQALYDEIYEWFRTNLRNPKRFARSSKPHAKNVALSWFKDEATEHIARMRCMAEILERHGLEVEMLRTNRPGYVVYEDRFQVVAEPVSETVT
jgi:hypothetical protein